MTKTHIAFLLDRSGSMESIKSSTIEAFNAYLNTLKDADAEIYFTLLTFDSISVDTIARNVPVRDVPELTTNVYQPRGGTPLIDAAVKLIRAVESSLISDENSKVVICIQTDGLENASKEYEWHDLNALVKEKTEAGWQFNFMGASIDAYEQAGRMGISAAHTMSYDAKSGLATVSAFRATGRNTVGYAMSITETTAYDDKQKQQAGDIYQPKAEEETPQIKPVVDDIKL